jgi:anti-sigma factor RsiW
MSDRWTDILSDYIDGGLDDGDRRELESHLDGCEECSATLADLRRVVSRARSLPERAPIPETDLWPGIEARIRGSARHAAIPTAGAPWSARRVSFSLPQLAAACLAIALISGAAVWYARTSGLRQAEPSGGLIAGSGGSAATVAVPAAGAPEAGAGIEELRRILADGRDELDPVTVRTLQESLMIIEIAIGQARRALDADPANPYVRAHLDDTMRRKVELLRRATVLASAPR